MKKDAPRSSGEGESAEPDSVRQRILDAAFTLFTKRGYSATSTLDIATLARVSKRELYAYFKNKQGMLEAGVSARTRRMRTPLDMPKVTTRAALEATLIAFSTTLVREVSHPHVIGLHRIAVAESARAPELAATLNEQGRQTNHRVLAGLLKDAQEAGLIGKGEPRELAAQFMALLWGDLLSRMMLGVSQRPDARKLEQRARNATAAFLKLNGS
jgi:AcrR family transcriptional regulator